MRLRHTAPSVDALRRLLQTGTGTGGSMVVKRHVFFIAGFDPFDIAGQYRRFRREAATFQNTWNVTATVSDLKQADDVTGHWIVSARGPNWATESIYEPLAWHDIVVADTAGSMLQRLRDGAATLWDFIKSGTATRYFRSNWRYALLL